MRLCRACGKVMEPLVENGWEQCSLCGRDLPAPNEAPRDGALSAREPLPPPLHTPLHSETGRRQRRITRGLPWFAGGGLLLLVLFYLVLPAMRMSGAVPEADEPLLEIQSLTCSSMNEVSYVAVGELGNLASHWIMNIGVEMEYRLADGTLVDRSATHIMPDRLEVGGTVGFKVYGRHYGREAVAECRISRIYHFHNNRPISYRDRQLPAGLREVSGPVDVP